MPGTTGRGRPGRSGPSIFLRAAELLAGPWRSTLVAATMLGQSKTAHQAEIDAACELVDFWRFNVHYMKRIYEEQPASSAGVWNRMEYRPLEGFVFAVTPFNFTAIGGNLSVSPALMGNTVVWKPASTAAYSAHFVMQILREAGLPDGVINLVYGHGAAIGDPALASPDLAGVHFTGSTGVFNAMWGTIGSSIDRYRSYPRIVGETGGKDFIVAHPSADADAVVTAVVRGLVRVPGSEVLRGLPHLHPRVALGRHARRACRPRGRAEGRRRGRLRELHGRGHRRQGVRDAQAGPRRGALERAHRRRGRHAPTTPRASSSSRP